jgi:hypothetical protein
MGLENSGQQNLVHQGQDFYCPVFGKLLSGAPLTSFWEAWGCFRGLFLPQPAPPRRNNGETVPQDGIVRP